MQTARYDRTGQVEVPADPDTVRQQARQPGSPGHLELEELRAFDDERRVEFAVLEMSREADVKPRQVQRARNRTMTQPNATTVHLPVAAQIGTLWGLLARRDPHL